jgi:hypothetical protein
MIIILDIHTSVFGYVRDCIFIPKLQYIVDRSQDNVHPMKNIYKTRHGEKAWIVLPAEG